MEADWIKNLARVNLPVYKFESDTTRIIYAGYSAIKKSYFARLMLEPGYTSSFAGRKWYNKIPRLLSRDGIDIAVCEISPVALDFFMRSEGYVIPEWTTVRINIDRSIDELCHKSVSNFKDVKRHIRKYDLTYEVLNDEKSFKYFYDHMYLPYISKRHGEEAWIEGLDEILKPDTSHGLLAIKEKGEIVGASAFSISEGSLYLERLGLLEGNEEYRRHGVIGATYFFGVIEGQKAGCKYLNVGGTRPFLSDGLTRYKLSLGAEFVQKLSPTKEYLWLGINEHSESAKRFLANNRFYHVNKDFRLVKSAY